MDFIYDGLPFKEYGGEHKNVFIGAEQFGAFFPENHSVLAGIVLETRDINPYAGTSGAISDWHTKCFTLLRERAEWGQYYEGPQRGFSVGDIHGDTCCGLFRVLVQFELDDVKNRISRENEVKIIKREIKEYTFKLKKNIGRLRELQKN
ncbi:MAG: hypothetical protein KJ646_02865 [Nanoarchaeota archaeon]|nr:hypothetical protein [Nanoarchaeota archaeon]